MKRASTRAIERATAEIRDGATSKISKHERATVRALEKSLRAAGAKDARITVKAGRRAGEARALIDVAVSDIARLGEALRIVRR